MSSLMPPHLWMFTLFAGIWANSPRAPTTFTSTSSGWSVSRPTRVSKAPYSWNLSAVDRERYSKYQLIESTVSRTVIALKSQTQRQMQINILGWGGVAVDGCGWLIVFKHFYFLWAYSTFKPTCNTKKTQISRNQTHNYSMHIACQHHKKHILNRVANWLVLCMHASTQYKRVTPF